MFLGEFHLSIDEKGRVAIPVKFRPALASGVVITRGFDASLALYGAQTWETFARQLGTLPLGSQESRAFARFMLAGAMNATLDSQGRFVIPEYLREYANLQREVVLIGVEHRCEFWNPEAWKTYILQTQKNLDVMSGELCRYNV